MTAQPVRGTQSFVGQMGWVFLRPSLTAIEIAWRWLAGAPILLVCWIQLQQILAELPPEATGLQSLDITNPWVSALKLAVAWDMYRSHVVSVLRWLVPAGAVAWIIVSAIGRNIVLKRMEPRIAFRPVAMIALQAAWVAVFALTGWAWWASIGWAAKNHIGTGAEPDLIITFPTQGLLLLNEDPNNIVQVSFNGITVDDELNPSLPSKGIAYDNRVVSKIWFRMSSGSSAIVSIRAWGIR